MCDHFHTCVCVCLVITLANHVKLLFYMWTNPLSPPLSELLQETLFGVWLLMMFIKLAANVCVFVYLSITDCSVTASTTLVDCHVISVAQDSIRYHGNLQQRTVPTIVNVSVTFTPTPLPVKPTQTLLTHTHIWSGLISLYKQITGTWHVSCTSTCLEDWHTLNQIVVFVVDSGV